MKYAAELLRWRWRLGLAFWMLC